MVLLGTPAEGRPARATHGRLPTPVLRMCWHWAPTSCSLSTSHHFLAASVQGTTPQAAHPAAPPAAAVTPAPAAPVVPQHGLAF